MNAKTVISLVALGAAATMTVSACGARASRYRTDAITFIDSDTMFDAYGVDFENVDCSEPESTDEGATVACRADGTDGQSYVLTFTIVGKNELELSGIALVGTLPPSSEPDASSPPESSGPDSTGVESSGPTSVPPTTTAAAPSVTAPAPGPAPTTAAAAPTTSAAAPATTAAAPVTTAAAARPTTTAAPG